MPGYPTDVLNGYAQFRAMVSDLTARVRRLETAQAPAPLLVLPATDPSTTSATDVVLWKIGPDGRTNTTVSLTVVPILSAPATAFLTLRDVNGQIIATADVSSGRPATLATQAPADGPYTLSGRTDTGTLSVAMISASAPRWVAQDLAG